MQRIRRHRIAQATLLLGCSIALGCDNHVGKHGVTQPVTTPTIALVQLAADDFNRANENPIAGTWTSGPGVASDVQLLDNAVKAVGDPTVNGNGVAFWSAATWPANQWSEVTIPAVPTTDDVGPAVRIAATEATYYLAPVYPNGRLAIYRAIDHAFVQLYTTAPGTVVAGDRVRLEAAGTVLRVFKNGVLMGEVVDDAIVAGAAGLVVDDVTGVVDDWAGGSLDSAPPPPPPPPPPPGADRVPDLGMARLADLRIERSNGRRRLRYSTTIVNVGAGKFEVRGQRAHTGEPTMSVVQRVFDDAGGWREVTTAGTMIFGGDGHDHWHVRDLQQSELFRLADDAYLAQSDKRGFCFWDNVRYQLTLPGAPQSPVYSESGCGGTSSLSTSMGLSIGWGDIYPYSLPDQFIDVTNLPDGFYRLVVTADPFSWFTEASDDNNFTWVSLELWDRGRRVRVLDYGPNALVAASLREQWRRTWPAPRARPGW